MEKYNPYLGNQQLETEILKCNACGLEKKVCFPMEGNPSSRVLIVGQGPHPFRKRGQPHFSGKAGKYFELLLGTLGLTRESVLITNAIKCIDGKKEGSLTFCRKFTIAEIAMIHPEELFVLGNKAAFTIFGKSYSYGPHNIDGVHCYFLPHPATCIRGGPVEQKEAIRTYNETIQKIRRYREARVKDDKCQRKLDDF